MAEDAAKSSQGMTDEINAIDDVEESSAAMDTEPLSRSPAGSLPPARVVAVGTQPLYRELCTAKSGRAPAWASVSCQPRAKQLGLGDKT